MDEIRDTERKTEVLRAKSEQLEQEVSIAEKKRMIAEAKRQYGPDWKKVVGDAAKFVGKNMKIDKEAIQTLHSLGVGGNDLRNLSNPAMLKKYK